MAVEIIDRGGTVEATFEFADDQLTTARNFGIHVWLTNYGDDGNGPAYQAMATWSAGSAAPDVDVFDLGAAQNYNDAGTAEIDGSTVSAAFAFDTDSQLGDGWKWRAVVSEDTQDLYQCPDGLGASLQYVPSASAPPPSPSALQPLTDKEIEWLASFGYGPDDPEGRAMLPNGHRACEAMATTDPVVAFTYDWGDTRDKMIRTMELLCDLSPEMAAAVEAMQTPGAWADGLHYVGKGDAEVAPGKYRTIGAVTNCYWKRGDEDGGIIANDMVDSAPGGVRITVKKGDYSIESQRCGVWVPAE